MGNKKITDLPSATAVNAGDKVEIVQGGTSKQADVNLLASGGGLSGLTTNKVLKAGSATTAVDSNITDSGTTTNSTISLNDGQIQLLFNNGTQYGYYTVNGGGIITSFTNGSNSGTCMINPSSNNLTHSIKNTFDAPLHEFNNSVTKNGVEVATVNDIPSYPTTYDLFITTGNQTTTSNVASNITGLVSPTLTANKRYRISGVIHFGCNGGGGVKYQITVPSGATLWVMGHSNLTNANTITWTPVLSSATLSPSFAGAVSADYGALCIDGEISIGATAGVIQFGFASATNTQTSTVYQLGTQLTLTQIN